MNVMGRVRPSLSSSRTTYFTIYISILCCQSLPSNWYSCVGVQIFTSSKKQQPTTNNQMVIILSRMKFPPKSNATTMLSRSVVESMMPIPPSFSKPSTTFKRVSHSFSSTTTTSSSLSSSVSIIPFSFSKKYYSTMMITMMSMSSSKSISNFPKNHPFAMNLIIATSKTCAADIVVQTVIEKKKVSQIDWKRNGIFIIFGFVYLGGFQWWLLINKFKQWFPTMEKFGKLSLSKKVQYKDGIKDAIKMIAFDVIIHSPIVYFPTYYTVKESVIGVSKKGNWNPMDWFYEGITNCKKNIIEDLKAMVTVTIPSDCIQVILPLHLRMIVRHFVSFFWTSYISFSRGAINNNNNNNNEKQQ